MQKSAIDDICPCSTDVKMEKRDAIFQAAIDVFAEFGYQNADVQEIARRAGVGKGTVYRYFTNKEQLFWATSLYVIQGWCEPLMPIWESDDNAENKLRKFTMSRAQFFEDNPKYIEIMALQRAHFRGTVPENVHNYLHANFFGPIMKVVNAGIESGELRMSDPTAFFLSYCAITYGTIVTYCHFGHFISLTEMTRLTLDTMFASGNKSGEKLAELVRMEAELKSSVVSPQSPVVSPQYEI